MINAATTEENKEFCKAIVRDRSVNLYSATRATHKENH